jgi:hypothetical protein
LSDQLKYIEDHQGNLVVIYSVVGEEEEWERNNGVESYNLASHF